MSEQKLPVHLVPPVNEGARDGTGHRDHPLFSPPGPRCPHAQAQRATQLAGEGIWGWGVG